MKLAWEQIGEILPPTARSRFLQLSLKAARQPSSTRASRRCRRTRAARSPRRCMRRCCGTPMTISAGRGEPAAARGAERRDAQAAAAARPARAAGAAGGRARGRSRASLVGLNDGTLSAAPPRPPVAGPTLEQSPTRSTPAGGSAGCARLVRCCWLLLRPAARGAGCRASSRRRRRGGVVAGGRRRCAAGWSADWRCAQRAATAGIAEALDARDA